MPRNTELQRLESLCRRFSTSIPRTDIIAYAKRLRQAIKDYLASEGEEA
jgi:hypothetical protein